MPTFVDKSVFARLDAKCRETAQKQLVDLAKREHAKVIKQCLPSAHSVAVDGKQNAPVEAVKPNGVIYFEYNYFQEIAALAIETLEAKSPIDKGDYFESHAVYVDSIETPIASIGMARRMVIASVLPYSRIIEVGAGKRVPWSKQPRAQTPGNEGAYNYVVKVLRRNYSSIVTVRFGWVGLDQGKEVPDAKRTKRYPAIIIEMR